MKTRRVPRDAPHSLYRKGVSVRSREPANNTAACRRTYRPGLRQRAVARFPKRVSSHRPQTIPPTRSPGRERRSLGDISNRRSRPSTWAAETWRTAASTRCDPPNAQNLRGKSPPGGSASVHTARAVFSSRSSRTASRRCEGRLCIRSLTSCAPLTSCGSP